VSESINGDSTTGVDIRALSVGNTWGKTILVRPSAPVESASGYADAGRSRFHVVPARLKTGRSALNARTQSGIDVPYHALVVKRVVFGEYQMTV
jgi:hypothetical protein